jgi:hypothetical protein
MDSGEWRIGRDDFDGDFDLDFDGERRAGLVFFGSRREMKYQGARNGCERGDADSEKVV